MIIFNNTSIKPKLKAKSMQLCSYKATLFGLTPIEGCTKEFVLIHHETKNYRYNIQTLQACSVERSYKKEFVAMNHL